MSRNKKKIIRTVTVPQSLGFCREVMPMRKSMAGKARKMIADRFEKNFVQKCQIEFYERVLSFEF